jgi:type II secretory pathway component PulJ
MTAEQTTEVAERQRWLQAQIEKVHAALEKQPEKIRRGELWKETKRAMDALRTSLEMARASNYDALLAGYAEGDHELLDSLPAGTSGVTEYRTALNVFERVRDRAPQTPHDVATAEAAARRLKEIRERVEADAVPSDFRTQWRSLRGAGIPLSALTPEFRQWLEEHGVAENVMVVYRGQ